MKFVWSTIGHESVKQYAELIVSSGHLPAHAFAFVGQEHIGKTIFAREFISILMCESKELRPCGNCVHCTHIAKQEHPDVYHIGPTEDRSSIVVEDVRGVVEQLHTSSFFKYKKICLIEDAQLLTAAAGNALLKTLEEPSGDTIFLFVSHSEQALLPTIRSRCQVIRMYTFSTAFIYDALIARSVAPGDARDLSRSSSGRIGTIWKFIEDPTGWAKEKETLSHDIRTLFAPGAQKHRWYEDPDTIPFQQFVRHAHDALLSAINLREKIECSFGDYEMLKNVDPARFVSLLETCMSAVRLRSMNVNAKLTLDMIHRNVRDVIEYS